MVGDEDRENEENKNTNTGMSRTRGISKKFCVWTFFGICLMISCISFSLLVHFSTCFSFWPVYYGTTWVIIETGELK